MNGPLHGMRVVELASFWGPWAGKLLGDLGADIVVVEPPGGHATRAFGPFVDDVAHPDRSLWWWYYNTSKRSVVLDLDADDGRAQFRRLVAEADVVLEGESPERLARLGIDHDELRADRPELIWASVTSHGRASPRSSEPWTDLTLSAASGIVWMNGYDDHSLPPMRGRGNQTIQVAGTFAAMAVLTAVLHRDAGGSGQHIDVSAFAAANVTTESGSYVYLVSGDTVQRQTGRHAMTMQTQSVQVRAADGTYVSTGFLPHTGADLQKVLDWLDEQGLRESCPEVFFLELGVERGGVDFTKDLENPEGLAILGASRNALAHIAANIPAIDFFEGGQRLGLQVGIVLSPDEAFENQHFVARGMQVIVPHPELDRDIRYPGTPYQMPRSPWAITRRPPLVGEHDAELLDDM